MAISKLSQSSSIAGNKKSSAWDGSTSTGSYVPIQTFVIGAQPTAAVVFSNIPQTFSHLQLRITARGTEAGNTGNTGTYFNMICNNDTTSTGTGNYSFHCIYGDGSTMNSLTAYGNPGLIMERISNAQSPTGFYGTKVVDIIDYTSTSKYKTIKTIGALDVAWGGRFYFNSVMWPSLSPITTLSFYGESGGVFDQFSTFALYGIK
jgi:hypothetical protein